MGAALERKHGVLSTGTTQNLLRSLSGAQALCVTTQPVCPGFSPARRSLSSGCFLHGAPRVLPLGIYRISVPFLTTELSSSPRCLFPQPPRLLASQGPLEVGLLSPGCHHDMLGTKTMLYPLPLHHQGRGQFHWTRVGPTDFTHKARCPSPAKLSSEAAGF